MPLGGGICIYAFKGGAYIVSGVGSLQTQDQLQY